MSYITFFSTLARLKFLVVIVNLLILLILLVPHVGLAQITTGFLNCSGADCSACNIVDTANKVITWLIAILFMVFAVLAVMAGFKLVTSGGNPSAMSAAKESFTNVIIGLIIILSAWLIVDTMIRGLGVTGIRGGPFPWSEVQCQSQLVPDYNRFESAAGATVLPQFSGRAGDPANLSDAQRTLAAAGVTVQNNVQLEGVSQARLNEIAGLATQCAAAMGQSCGIQVSSGVRQPGNPAGVGAHGTGQALDLSSRHSPLFNQWMRQQETYPPVQSFGNFRGFRVSPSTVCTWEGPDGDSSRAHWHCAPPTR